MSAIVSKPYLLCQTLCHDVITTSTSSVPQLAECAMGHASQLTPEQIRNLCVSFAKLGYFNTQFKSVMADAIIDKLDQYDPALLADTAWAFGEALYYDYDLMQNLHAYLKQNAEKFDASGMAKVRAGAPLQWKKAVATWSLACIMYDWCAMHNNSHSNASTDRTSPQPLLMADMPRPCPCLPACLCCADAVDLWPLWDAGPVPDGHDARDRTQAAGRLQQQGTGRRCVCNGTAGLGRWAPAYTGG